MKTECEELWAVHVIGPDEFHAAASRETAEKWAANLQIAMDAFAIGEGPNFPRGRAVAAQWPGDAASHSADLARSSESR